MDNLFLWVIEFSKSPFFFTFFVIFSFLMSGLITVISHRLPKVVHFQVIPALTFTFRGQSKCPKCRHKLSLKDVFPVFGFLLNKGKCNYCHQKISIRYPIIELLGAIPPVALFTMFNGIELILLLVLFWISYTLIIIDWETFYLPDILVYSLLFVGLAYSATGYGLLAPSESILTIIFTYLGILTFKVITIRIMKKDALGDGDVKLIAALSGIVGPIGILMVLFLSSLLNIFSYLIEAIFRKESLKEPKPFGPSIIAAFYLVFIFSITGFELHFL
ncbi:MAG: prepilin peptidase [Methyloprofundus sp.]|nr:prepilin peptidase [Methyloprofundus sp.]